MPSDPSPSSPVLRGRRRHASQTALFPTCPDAQSPKQVAGRDLAPITVGPGVSVSSYPNTADCPPPCSGTAPVVSATMAAGDAQRRFDGQTRSSQTPLVGIARLAASSPCAETSRASEQRPEYFLLPVRSILNKCDSNRVPFEWTINPYRGCEFACKYCYARYTHEYMGGWRRIREENFRETERRAAVGARCGTKISYRRRMVARSILRSALQRTRISRRSVNMA